MRIVCCTIILGLAVSAQAQTYRWVDPATGKTVISDNPPPVNARKVTRTTDQAQVDTHLSYAAKLAAERFPVTLYTAPECGDGCRLARELLNRRGVPFSEKVVKGQAEFDELKQLPGDPLVPSMKVGQDVLRGFNAEPYDKALDLAGYPRTGLPGKRPPGEAKP